LKVYKRSQLFVRTHNETLSIAAMRVSNKALPGQMPKADNAAEYSVTNATRSG
jgi:hypothetical protein